MNNLNCQYIKLSEGDTLESIASKYNTTVETILSLNPNLDKNNLPVQICIPIVCPIGSIPYKVTSGDTLSSIATKFYTTAETILKTNPNLNPYNLNIGEVICITEQLPKVPACPSLNIYVVNVGDTVYSIAKKFGITVETLLSINPDLNPYNLTIGSVICLPFTPTPYLIVVNRGTRELLLYHLGILVKTYPIAIGKPTTPTPLGQFYIANKQVNPGGPFGTRWMGLSIPHYGIHGTNMPESIGKAASNGCIRLNNRDVEELFSLVSVYTPVIIIE